MTELQKTCLNCSEVLGCPYLGNSRRGEFIPERVITEDHFRECPEWVPIGPHQKWVRDMMFGLQGEGSIRVLHQLPKPAMDEIVQQEKDEKEMNINDSPDFVAMLREGMTTAEREEQLRYETDDAGNVQVDDQGNKRPRAQFIISKFATDPDQHIKLDHGAGMFYKTDEVIKYILDKEVELGMLAKSKKSKKETQAAAPAVAEKKETKMPIEGRKIIRPVKNAPAAAAEPQAEAAPAPAAPSRGPIGLPKVPGMGKIAQPPKRPGAAPTQAPAEEAPQATAAAGFNPDEFLQEVRAAVGQVVDNALEKACNELLAQVSVKIEEERQRVVEAITIMHDLAIQTSGTFHNPDGSALNEMYENEAKIFGHLGG